MLDNILKHFEKQTKSIVKHNDNSQIEEDTPVNITSDTKQRDTNTNRIAVNNEKRSKLSDSQKYQWGAKWEQNCMHKM